MKTKLDVEKESDETKTFLIKLSDQNKDSLLRKEWDAALENLKKAQETIQRLQDLNPVVAATIGLKDAALSQFTFRLLCSPKPSHDVPSYLAISYCWRDTEFQKWNPVIRNTAMLWNICRPMVDEILKLRSSPDEGVWMDASCINQKDDEEKILAIGSMDVLYRAARLLIIVLEDVQLAEDEQAAAVRYFGMCQNVAASGPGEKLFDILQEKFDPSEAEYNVTINFLQKILSARWFTRGWCSHEIKIRPREKENSPRVLLFGSEKEVLIFEYRWIYIFTYFLAYVDKRRSSINPPISTLSQVFPPLQSLIHRCIHTIGCSESSTNTILTMLLDTFACDIGVEVDRISIAMNLGRLGLYYKGPSGSSDWCYWIFIALLLAAGDMSPLTVRGPKLRIPLTSWAQRPRMDEGRVTVENTSGLIGIKSESIELDLFLIYSVPQLPSSDKVRLADFIINRSSIDSESNGVFSQWPELYGHKWLVNALALSLDCGLDWILRFTRLIQEQSETEEWTLGSLPQSDPRLEGAALEVLFIFKVSTDQSTGFRERYLNPVTHFLTFLIDERFKRLTIVPRRIFAGVNSGYAFTPRTMASFWFAVPTPLAETTCFHSQVWLLEPFDPELDGAVPDETSEPLFNTADGTYRGFNPNMGESPSSVLLKHLIKTPPEKGESLALDVLTFDEGVERAEPNGKGTWRLMEKTNFVGCLLPISDDGNAVRLLKRQTVYG
jgi:hypothetical protein